MNHWLTRIANDYGSLPSAGAVIVSALIALCIALYTIGTNRAIARRKATLDLIIMSETAEFFRTLTTNLNTIRDENPDGIASVIPILTKKVAKFKRNFDPENPPLISQDELVVFKTVQSYLNYYELIAVGIDNRILDEKFYCNWMQSNFISTWEWF